MREIKFRAWDKITKKYFYSGTLDNGDILVIHLDGEIEISSDDTYKPEDFIIEQFTGLRDNNGREIYEGDIVSCDKIHIRDMSDPDPFTRRIGWNEDAGALVFFMMDGRPHASGYTYCKNNLETIFHIIGNIHENPELLP